MIGSCAFGIECNTFEDPNNSFAYYGQRIFFREKLKQLVVMFAESFPNAGKALHITTTQPDVEKFFKDIVRKTVEYRETNNITRNDFMQMMIEIKNSEKTANGVKGEFLTYCFFPTCILFERYKL